MSIVRKGNPFVPTGIEAMAVAGLTKEAVPIRKEKAFGADVAYCPRRVVLYTLVDPEHRQPVSPASSLYMAVGTAFHRVMQTAYENAGRLLAEEYYVKDDRISSASGKSLGGYIDAIILDDDGELAIVDIKTCGKVPAGPDFAYSSQIIAYAISSGVTRGYVHYVSRNVATFDGSIIHKVYPIDMSRKSIVYSARMMARSTVYMRAGLVPKIPPHIRSKSNCRYCPFVPYCWEDSHGIPLEGDREATEDEAFDLNTKADKLARKLIADMPKRLEWTKRWIAEHGTPTGRELFGGGK